MKSTLRLASLAFAAFLLVGCGKPWKVVSQAAPNPFTPASKFTLEPPNFEKLMQGKWKTDVPMMQEAFSSGYSGERGALGVASAPTDGFIIKTEMTKVESGTSIVVNIPTELDARVTVVDAKGTELDVFTVRVAESATLASMDSGTRFKHAAERLGRITAEYMKFREGIE